MRTVIVSVLFLAGLGLAACGSGDEEGADEGPRVVATTGIVADIVQEVAGSGIEVEQVIPDGSSPHDFQLSARDRQTLEEANLLIVNGAGLEAGIPLDDIDGPRWTLTQHVGDLLPFEDHADPEDDHGHADGDAHENDQGRDDEAEHDHDHGPDDPHVWMDPSRVQEALPALARALARVDPDGAAGYRERADDYAARLADLDADLDQILGAVPPGDRGLITSHDSLGYLADRYGFRIVATTFPATGAEAEVSAARIADVRRSVQESGVSVVFAQREDNPAALRRIAAEAGVEIEDGLVVESTGDAGSYEEMLRRNAELIAAALTG